MNQKLNCLVVDDEPWGRQVIERFISRTPFLELAASCEDAMDALDMLQNTSIDLLFSDIQMPGLTGLAMVRSLPSPPTVIFITAHDKFAAESYELNVIDYLVKPVEYERFLKAVNKAREWTDVRNAKAASSVHAPQEAVYVKADAKIVKVLFKEILYIEGAENYVKIHLIDGKPVLTNSSMKAIIEKLPANRFFRIHNSYIVNMEAAKAIMGNTLEMIGGGAIPIARNRKEDLLTFLDIHYNK